MGPTRDFAENFIAKGWRVCCFVKRGGGYLAPLPLSDWTPTDLTSFDDILLGLQKVRETYSKNFIGIAGLSAGGAWVRRYCSVAAAGMVESLADAAVCLDGGYAWWETIQRVDKNNPMIGKVMGAAMAQPLLRRAAENPEQVPEWLDVQGLEKAQLKSWSAVMEIAHKKKTDAPTLMDYFHTHCDSEAHMKLPQRSSVPCLILASYADGCCPRDYWTNLDKVQEIPSNCPNTIVCLQSSGAHCCRPTGFLGQGNWAADAATEFFTAVQSDIQNSVPSCSSSVCGKQA